MLKISYNNHKQLDTTDLFMAYNEVDIEKINTFKKIKSDDGAQCEWKK